LGEDADLVNILESRFVNRRVSLDGQHDLSLALERLAEGMHALLASHEQWIGRRREGNEVS
jgi:hypothetical protein